VSWKMQERIDKAINRFNSFKKYYESSDFINEADMKLKELNELKTI
jgi:pterin-4a-carbinolamine dehydratase